MRSRRVARNRNGQCDRIEVANTGNEWIGFATQRAQDLAKRGVKGKEFAKSRNEKKHFLTTLSEHRNAPITKLRKQTIKKTIRVGTKSMVVLGHRQTAKETDPTVGKRADINREHQGAGEEQAQTLDINVTIKGAGESNTLDQNWVRSARRRGKQWGERNQRTPMITSTSGTDRFRQLITKRISEHQKFERSGSRLCDVDARPSGARVARSAPIRATRAVKRSMPESDEGAESTEDETPSTTTVVEKTVRMSTLSPDRAGATASAERAGATPSSVFKGIENTTLASEPSAECSQAR